ncbi:siphovirus ReqiPepy6 Gp37-like family protein [Micromonospora sp. NPDC049240]|uniref:siphovirus ReqiPepy6 Gp37-like family protein n=1 Tax=Micromonospora sp. NPDC049240 TaxID=3155151 RepID=UPI0034083CCB
MQYDDILIEVRDRDLTRLGQILPEEAELEASLIRNNVGTWKLTLPVDHPLTPALRTKGSGIVVTGPTDVLLSGPTVKPEAAVTMDNPGGLVTFEGVTDDVVLADMLAAPEPSNPDLATQKKSHDVRTAVAEDLLHQYVDVNIGPSAPLSRRKARLSLGANLHRGTVMTKSARFPVLGELMAEIATVDSLGFRVVQRGSELKLETSQAVDRFAEIRLDVDNGTLAGHRVSISPPGATQVIVAGQEEGVKRQFLALNTPASLAAEAEWGRRIERFIDQRQTDDWDELRQAGMEVLTEEGFSTLSIQAVPAEDTLTMEFGRDWNLGDRVTVVVEGQELVAVVAGCVIKLNADGLKVGVAIGDPSGFDASPSLSTRVQGVESRVSLLERNAEVAAPPPLPDPLVVSATGGTVTSTSWTNLPGIGSVGLTLARDAVVTVEYGAWLSISSGGTATTLRVGVSCDDADPDALLGGGWGQVLFQSSPTGNADLSVNNGQSTTVTGKLAAGSHTFELQAYKAGSRVTTVNFPVLRVTVHRWAS